MSEDELIEAYEKDVRRVLSELDKQNMVCRPTKASLLKPVQTPVAILGSLGVCIYVPASRHWLISYSPIHLI